MHCLKCGTEIEAPQVFCDRCLVDMKNHPVSRETPVVSCRKITEKWFFKIKKE